jgi:hypothetical protein
MDAARTAKKSVHGSWVEVTILRDVEYEKRELLSDLPPEQKDFILPKDSDEKSNPIYILNWSASVFSPSLSVSEITECVTSRLSATV